MSKDQAVIIKSSSTSSVSTVAEKKESKTLSTSISTLSSEAGQLDSKVSVRFPSVQAALIAAYLHKNTLPLPLSKNEFPIQAISLTISEKQKQKKGGSKLREDTDSKENASASDQKESSSMLSDREEVWRQVEKSIEIKNIFTPDKEAKDQSRADRVLIEGRAGVGKTTLSQYIAWQWAEQSLFRNDYDYVLWIPLRQWLSGDFTVATTFQEDLAAFVHENYCKDYNDPPLLAELEKILSDEHNSRTLLILDGYDEVARYFDEPESIAGKLLLAALDFKQVIVTTRDYQIPPTHTPFKRQLVNIGFTDKQISDYLQQYANWLKSETLPGSSPRSTSDSKLIESSIPKKTPQGRVQALLTVLQRNPRLWQLVHVPLNLTLICETYQQQLLLDSKETVDKTFANISLTALYQEVVQGFLIRHLRRGGVKSTTYIWETLREDCVLELSSLGILALEGLKAGEVVLSAKVQRTALAALLVFYNKITSREDIENRFLNALDMGFVSTEGSLKENPYDQPRYFIHLTFQEFFAAYGLLLQLQGYYGRGQYETAMAWIAEHKYQPRYAMVMGFLAGLTVQPGYDQALEAFWYALLSPPYEITGALEIRLMIRCLEEANFDKRIPMREDSLEKLSIWSDCAVRGYKYKCKSMDWFIDYICGYPRVLKHSRIASLLLKALQEEKEKSRSTHSNVEKAIEALGKIGIVEPTEDIVVGLLKILRSQVSDYSLSWIDLIAVRALVKIGSHNPTILSALISRLLSALTLQDVETEFSHIGAAEALGDIGFAFPTSELVQRLLKILQDKSIINESVGWFSIRAEIQTGVIGALGKIGVKDPTAIIPALLQVLDQSENYRPKTRSRVAESLGKIGAIVPDFPGITVALFQVLQNEQDDEDVRVASVDALGEIGTAFPSTSRLVLTLQHALKDENSYVRAGVVRALGKIAAVTTDKSLLENLFQALHDKDDNIRSAAVDSLEKIGIANPNTPGLIRSLLLALQDEDGGVQYLAMEALEKIGVIVPTIKELAPGLLQLLHSDKDWHIRCLVAELLGVIGRVIPDKDKIVISLLKAMRDIRKGPKEIEVRKAAIQALGVIGAINPNVQGLVVGLLQAVLDKEKAIRSRAADALGEVGETAPNYVEIIDALFGALNDKDEWVKKNAARALTKIAAVAPDKKRFVIELLKVLSKSFFSTLNYELLGHNFEEDSVERSIELAIFPVISKLPLLFSHHFDFASQVKQWPQKLDPNWLRIVTDFIHEEKPGIILGNKNLQLISGAQLDIITVPKMEYMQPILAGLQKKCKEVGWPLPPTLEQCQGKTLRYPDVRKPDFKPSVLPKLMTVSKSLEKKPMKKSSPETENKFSRSQQLKTRLKPVGSVPVKSLSTPVEEKLRAELLYTKQRQLLETFLQNIAKAVERESRLYLSHLPDKGRLTRPQVFISYAWEADKSPKLKHLQKFLSSLVHDLRLANLNPWLDIEKMTGYIDGQMRDNIEQSQFVLLIGTNRYAQRTKPTSPSEIKTNVRKELEFTLEQAKKSKDFLLPLLLEGDWQSNFPFPEEIKSYIVRDGRSWVNFEVEGWLNFTHYVNELTASSPLGILPSLLGFSDKDKDYPEYREALRVAYQQHEKILQFEFKELARTIGEQQEQKIPVTVAPIKTPAPVSSGSSSSTVSSSSSMTSTFTKPPLPTRLPGKKPPEVALSENKEVTMPPSQTMQEFQQKLQKLCSESGYTFSIKPQADRLVLQFTALKTVLANSEEIRSELITATRLLQKLVADSGIQLQPNQFKPDWSVWSLTIHADTFTIGKLVKLLQTAGSAFLSQESRTRMGFFAMRSSTSSSIGSGASHSEDMGITCSIQ